jgi:hypothetical protein
MVRALTRKGWDIVVDATEIEPVHHCLPRRGPTLEAVVDHYDNHLKLELTAAQKRELIEYLKSL